MKLTNRPSVKTWRGRFWRTMDYYVITLSAENHLTFSVNEFTAGILVRRTHLRLELDTKVKGKKICRSKALMLFKITLVGPHLLLHSRTFPWIWSMNLKVFQRWNTSFHVANSLLMSKPSVKESFVSCAQMPLIPVCPREAKPSPFYQIVLQRTEMLYYCPWFLWVCC